MACGVSSGIPQGLNCTIAHLCCRIAGPVDRFVTGVVVKPTQNALLYDHLKTMGPQRTGIRRGSSNMLEDRSRPQPKYPYPLYFYTDCIGTTGYMYVSCD